MIYYIHRQGKDVAIETESAELSSGGQGKIYKICSDKVLVLPDNLLFSPKSGEVPYFYAS